MPRILITGATGFVGSCLARFFVEMGYEVHIFTRTHSNKWRISDLLQSITNHEIDLRDAEGVKKLVTRIRPSIIFHSAVFGGFSSQNDAQSIIETNFTGTVNLLRACEEKGFDYFINFGSSSEYGVKQKPMKESDVLEPLGAYAVSKAAAALYCRSEAIGKGLPVVTLRLFSPFGPWDNPQRLIPYVISSLLEGQSPELSSPRAVRDYVFIEDVLDLCLKLIKEPPLAGEVFNVGSGVQHSIGYVVSAIANIVGTGIRPVWGAVETKRREPDVWVGEMQKLKSRLNWEPNHSFDAGLRETINWLRHHLTHYPSKGGAAL